MNSTLKTFHPLAAVASLLSLSLASGWLAGGCAASSRGSSIPKPGSGIAEYRQVASQAHRSVADVVDALEALARSSPQASAPQPELAGFDRAFMRLELTSVKARSRAEAIIARGQAYFDEWKEQLTGMTNQPAAATAAERYDRLFEHFGRVRQRSGDVREEFRPFMMKLREFRARLDKSPIPPDAEAFRKELDGLAAHGRRVLQTLESVTTALDDADVELRKTLESEPSKGTQR